MPKLTCVCPAELFMAAISALCYTPPARFFSSNWSLFCTWFSYTSGFPSTCTLYLHTALPMRHTCIRISCQSRESFKESLQYNRDAVMRGLHHTASRRVSDVPSQRSRHAFFLTAGVEGQVSIDAFTSANPLFARAQQRTLLENRSWPVRPRLRETLQITTQY